MLGLPASYGGVGSFGSEGEKKVTTGDRYLATRGPLTRARLEMYKQSSPRIYGDPALLVPEHHPIASRQEYKVGLILRWSERARKRDFDIDGVRLIDLETDSIEDTLDAITSCEVIVSTSLHGLILADAYGIPNAWLIADTGYGKEHKFWDYLLSVRKERDPVEVDTTEKGMTVNSFMNRFSFDDRKMKIDLEALKDSNPFTGHSPRIAEAEDAALAGAKEMAADGRIDKKSLQPRYLK
ncbi:MAG: polysaccharide pyruvyl transferase family protein [Brevibacterium sp.]|nr:polysaccharide pyruvyl transferase family protein [Brevibacterium sp.]